MPNIQRILACALLACNLGVSPAWALEILKPNDPFVGIHYDLLWEANQDPASGDLAEVISRIKELNVGTVRMPIRWSVVQTVGTDCSVASLQPHAVNMAKYRSILDQLPRYLEIVAYLDTPPTACRNLFSVNPDAFALSYANYVHQVVAAFKDRVKYWEVWNEVNNNDFYLKPPYATYHWSAWDYAKQLLKPAKDAIRAEDPQAVVLAGAFSLNGVEGHVNATPTPPRLPGDSTPWYLIPNFLNNLLSANAQFGGAPNAYFDGLSMHPYHKGTRLSSSTDYLPFDQTFGSSSMMTALQQAGLSQGDIYWTEAGASLASVGNNEDNQLVEIQKILSDAYRGRAVPPDAGFKLKKAVLYSLRDYSASDENGFGLINKKTGFPRKSFNEVKTRISSWYSIRNVIERFDSQRWGDTVNENFVQPFCAGMSTPEQWDACALLFWGDSTNPTLNFTTPATGNWGKVGAITRHISLKRQGITYSPGAEIDLKTNMFGWSATSNSNHYVVITVGPGTLWSVPMMEVLTPPSSLSLSLRRTDRTTLSIQLTTASAAGTVQELLPWQTISGCSNPDYSYAIQPYLRVETNGYWRLVIKDSFGKTCFTGEASNTSQYHSVMQGVDTSVQYELLMRVLGMTEKPRNSYFKLNDLRFESLPLAP